MDKRTKDERAELKKHERAIKREREREERKELIARLDSEARLYKAKAKKEKAKKGFIKTRRKKRVIPKLTKRDRYGYRWL